MDFVDILIQYDTPTAPEGHHHRTRGYVQFDCPFCGRGTYKYHMGYNIARGFVTCWRCGGHSLLTTICYITGLSKREAQKLIDQLDFVTVTEERKTGKKVVYPDALGKLQKAHKLYLKKRGFDWRQLQQLWEIQGIGGWGKLPWSIFIPVIFQGRTVSWTTRAIGSKIKERYQNAKIEESIMFIKNILYGLDYVRDTCIIFEGPLDVWRVGPGAVSVLGIKYTQKQVELLAQIPKRYICFDNEPLAQKRAKKLMNELGALEGETYLIKPDKNDAKDIDSAGEREINILKRLIRKG